MRRAERLASGRGAVVGRVDPAGARILELWRFLDKLGDRRQFMLLGGDGHGSALGAGEDEAAGTGSPEPGHIILVKQAGGIGLVADREQPWLAGGYGSSRRLPAKELQGLALI
jgi:hypothetical protein